MGAEPSWARRLEHNLVPVSTQPSSQEEDERRNSPRRSQEVCTENASKQGFQVGREGREGRHKSCLPLTVK